MKVTHVQVFITQADGGALRFVALEDFAALMKQFADTDVGERSEESRSACDTCGWRHDGECPPRERWRSWEQRAREAEEVIATMGATCEATSPASTPGRTPGMAQADCPNCNGAAACAFHGAVRDRGLREPDFRAIATALTHAADVAFVGGNASAKRNALTQRIAEKLREAWTLGACAQYRETQPVMQAVEAVLKSLPKGRDWSIQETALLRTLQAHHEKGTR